MTYYAVTHSNRFKAASAGAGATNMISMYAQTDLPGFYSKTYFGFPPWENFNFYLEHSSYYQVKNAKTPLLIQYGERDARCPCRRARVLPCDEGTGCTLPAGGLSRAGSRHRGAPLPEGPYAAQPGLVRPLAEIARPSRTDVPAFQASC